MRTNGRSESIHYEGRAEIRPLVWARMKENAVMGRIVESRKMGKRIKENSKINSNLSTT